QPPFERRHERQRGQRGGACEGLAGFRREPGGQPQEGDARPQPPGYPQQGVQACPEAAFWLREVSKKPVESGSHRRSLPRYSGGLCWAARDSASRRLCSASSFSRRALRILAAIAADMAISIPIIDKRTPVCESCKLRCCCAACCCCC